MGRQLNLRVSDEFVERLDLVARNLGQSMATVLEKVSTPALELAEADALFEAEALEAWEEYQLTGKHVSADAIEALFAESLRKAQSVAQEVYCHGRRTKPARVFIRGDYICVRLMDAHLKDSPTYSAEEPK